MRTDLLPVYHYPCGRRVVVVGQWGHMLAHPKRCPDCDPNQVARKLREGGRNGG